MYEVFWNIVDEHGFTPKWFEHSRKKSRKSKNNYGNMMFLQNLVDGLKLQPCFPTFIDARDAILLADKINYKEINICLIWKAFAKRGLGVNAKAGGEEDFEVPLKCKEK